MIQKISRNIQQPLRIFHKPSRQNHPSGHAKMMCVRYWLPVAEVVVSQNVSNMFSHVKGGRPALLLPCRCQFHTHCTQRSSLRHTIAVPTFQWRPNDIATHSIADDVQTDVFCHSTRNFFIFSKVAPMASGGDQQWFARSELQRCRWIIVQCRVSNCETNHRIDICCKNYRFFWYMFVAWNRAVCKNALVACCRLKWTQDFVPLKYNLTTKLWLASRLGTLRTMLWLVDAIGGWTSGVRTCPHHWRHHLL